MRRPLNFVRSLLMFTLCIFKGQFSKVAVKVALEKAVLNYAIFLKFAFGMKYSLFMTY